MDIVAVPAMPSFVSCLKQKVEAWPMTEVHNFDYQKYFDSIKLTL